ncbi:hypothetical protein ACRU44_23540 [Mycobacterium colombiense]
MTGNGNYADRKAEAASLFEAIEPLAQQAKIMEVARQYADENGLPYPATLVQGINKLRGLLRDAGLPQAEIDSLPGLGPLDG